MAIFKKNSPLDGNPCTPQGKMLEFKDMYYETEDEAEIAYLQEFKCFTQVEARDEIVEAKPTQAKSATGVISAAKLAGLAAQNK